MTASLCLFTGSGSRSDRRTAGGAERGTASGTTPVNARHHARPQAPRCPDSQPDQTHPGGAEANPSRDLRDLPHLSVADCVRSSLGHTGDEDVRAVQLSGGGKAMAQVNHVSRPAERGISRPALERILVGVDFRQPSLAAARWASTHFGSRTRIGLAHVRSVPEVPGFIKPMMPALDDRLERQIGSPLPGLRGFAATLGARDHSIHVRAGHTVSSLADMAGNLEADLVVLGRKAVDGNRGRTLERLIRRLNVPALVIGNGIEKRPRRILAAVDDAPIGRQVVDWAREARPAFRSRAHSAARAQRGASGPRLGLAGEFVRAHWIRESWQ